MRNFWAIYWRNKGSVIGLVILAMVLVLALAGPLLMPGDPWEIIGHERVVDLLQRAIRQQRIGHAYLISGPLGIGKRTLAIRLAQALNCERLGPGVTPHPNPLPLGEGWGEGSSNS